MSQINLEKKQYLQLLKAVHAWAMMEESQNEADGKRLDQHEYALNDYLLKFAPEFGLSKYDLNIRDWADDLFEESFEMIDEYAKLELWENLAWELADREYARRYGSEMKNHSAEENFLLRGEIQDEFMSEFVKNGLDNVTIGKQT